MLGNALISRIKEYSIGATATLLVTSEMKGQIVYHNYIPDLVLTSSNTPDYIDLDNDGIFDLEFDIYTHYHVTYFGDYTFTANAFLDGVNGAAIAVVPPYGYMLQKLPVGQIINSSLTWCGCHDLLAHFYIANNPTTTSSTSGNWNNVKDGFFAFRFKEDNVKYYGWMRMSVTAQKFIIKDYAYNSIPNEPISAGEDGCDWFTATLETIPGDTVCSGDTIMLKAQPPTGISYEWYSNGVITTNWHDSIEYYLTGNSNINVVVAASDGCPDTTEIHQVVHVNMSIPSIYEQNETLFSSQTNVSQWYLNSEPILGATNYFYVPAASGIYTVETYLGDCYRLSQDYSYFLSGVNDPLSETFYPQISQQTTSLLILLTSGESSRTQVTIFDLLGRKRFEESSDSHFVSISTAELETGEYILLIQSAKKRTIFRFTMK